MSGGHFNDCGYVYHKVLRFADELEQEISYNGIVNEDGYKYDYDPDVIDYLEDQIPKLRKMAEIMRHIDYLYSGDIGDDGFLLRVKETKAKYNDPIQQILNDPNDNLNERIANAMQEAIAEYDT
jgi:ABC-type protease/lipase transport system fused ATPase/permease subunit